jgi:hypothetical protein
MLIFDLVATSSFEINKARDGLRTAARFLKTLNCIADLEGCNLLSHQNKELHFVE